MILGLDIWVYNFQEVLGSIPSQALFPFFFVLSFPLNLRAIVSPSSRFKIKEVVYRCLVTAVFTILGNGRVTIPSLTRSQRFNLNSSALSADLRTDFFRQLLPINTVSVHSFQTRTVYYYLNRDLGATLSRSYKFTSQYIYMSSGVPYMRYLTEFTLKNFNAMI